MKECLKHHNWTIEDISQVDSFHSEVALIEPSVQEEDQEIQCSSSRMSLNDHLNDTQIELLDVELGKVCCIEKASQTEVSDLRLTERDEQACQIEHLDVDSVELGCQTELYEVTMLFGVEGTCQTEKLARDMF